MFVSSEHGVLRRLTGSPAKHVLERRWNLNRDPSGGKKITKICAAASYWRTWDFVNLSANVWKLGNRANFSDAGASWVSRIHPAAFTRRMQGS